MKEKTTRILPAARPEISRSINHSDSNPPVPGARRVQFLINGVWVNKGWLMPPSENRIC